MMESRPQARQLVVHLECEVTELFPISGGFFLGAYLLTGPNGKELARIVIMSRFLRQFDRS